MFILSNLGNPANPVSKTGPKKCGLLIFPGRLPQAPSGRQISSTAIIARQLRHKRHSVPPKESTLALNSREDASPKASTHRSFKA